MSGKNKIRLILYSSLLVYVLLVPLLMEWKDQRERMIELKEQCDNYHGMNQVFMERCYLFELGKLKEFQWSSLFYFPNYRLLLLLFLEPLYLFLFYKKKVSHRVTNEQQRGLTFEIKKNKVNYY